jgi:prolyl oligopeptidase
MQPVSLLLVAAIEIVLCGAALAALPPIPTAPKRPVTDTYWGVQVTDDYRYMENLNDPAVHQWAEGENAHTQAWLDGQPGRDAILSRVVALTHSSTPKYGDLTSRVGAIFAMKELPPKQQAVLVVLPSVDDLKGERAIVDPNEIDPSGATTIDFYVPSLEGRYVAVSLSKGGTEDGTIHIYEVATGHELPDRIPRVNGGTAGGSVAWNADATGIYYTRYPREGERPAEDLPFYQQVWFHKLTGSIEKDSYVMGKELPKIAEIRLETRGDGQALLIDVSNGDGGEHEYWLAPTAPGVPTTPEVPPAPAVPPVRVARLEDKVVDATLGVDGCVYLLSRKDAPNGKILKMPLEGDVNTATVVVPESQAAITGFEPMASRLYETDMWGGPSRVRIFSLDGKPIGEIGAGEVMSYGSLVPLEGDDVLVRRESYVEPAAYLRMAPTSKEPVPTALVNRCPADFSGCEVRREYAQAEDGTKIPVTILMRKGTKLDGDHPVLLYGYGSYGLSETPRFDASRMVWIERGGIWADASIRGGGEYGDAWHLAANLAKKKTSIDDFAACARYLVTAGYTRPERLAIEGWSAGGLLMYGAMIHYPDRMRAVVAHVGYGDILRTELSPNGLFNTTEFGTVKDSTQFRGMYAYSPYHHVGDGIRYPALLALTGLNDPRVEPWQSFKMVARLQAATAEDQPILLRTSAGTGHGGGTALSAVDQETADAFAFLFLVLNVKGPAPPTR